MYRAQEPEYRALAPDSWAITCPNVGSTDPIRISFDRHMDWISFSTGVVVLETNGDLLATRVDMANSLSARISPVEPWSTDRVVLTLLARVEDACGNRLDEPFESGRRMPEPTNPIGWQRELTLDIGATKVS